MIKTNNIGKPKLNRSPVTCPGLACFHGYNSQQTQIWKSSHENSQRKEIHGSLNKNIKQSSSRRLQQNLPLHMVNIWQFTNLFSQIVCHRPCSTSRQQRYPAQINNTTCPTRSKSIKTGEEPSNLPMEQSLFVQALPWPCHYQLNSLSVLQYKALAISLRLHASSHFLWPPSACREQHRKPG